MFATIRHKHISNETERISLLLIRRSSVIVPAIFKVNIAIGTSQIQSHIKSTMNRSKRIIVFPPEGRRFLNSGL